MERLAPHEITITENDGFREEELLRFLQQYPRVVNTLSGYDYVFQVGDHVRFPSLTTIEEEKTDPEVASRGFHRRVGMHSSAVGATFSLMLTSLREAGVVLLDDALMSDATCAVTMHDINKVPEIRWRGAAFGSSDEAYDAAEGLTATLLTMLGYPDELVKLAGSVGHNGARDYIAASETDKPWSLMRQAAYLADDLLQDTVIQTDVLAKARQLPGRYPEAYRAGFPEMRAHPAFTFPDGTLRPKFDIQYEATAHMAENVGQALGIAGSDLGKFLIQRATEANLYTATIINPTHPQA